MKKIGEIRTAGPFGTPLKDFWGKPMQEIYVDTTQSDDALRRQSEEFARQIQDLKSSQEFAAEQVEYAMAQAAEDIEKSISNQWILQSRKKVEKAEELLRAGLVSESLKLCSDAMSQDPSNMDSYIVASVAYGLANETDRSKECLRKTIHLLKTSEYETDVHTHLDVLENILQSEYKGDLIPDFLEVLKKNFLGLLRAKDYVYNLILKLSEISHDIAIEVAQQYFKLWTGFFKEEITKDKYDSWADSNALNYLYFRACYFDLHKHLKKIAEMGQNVFLEISYNQTRLNSLKKAFDSLQNYSDFLSETKDFIRQEVINALKNWEADIINEKRNEAKKNATGFSSGWGWFWFWLLSYVVIFGVLGKMTESNLFIAMGLAIIPPIIIHFLIKSIREQKNFNKYIKYHNDWLKSIVSTEQITSTPHYNVEKEKPKTGIPAFNFCPECGVKIHSEDNFCQNCGLSLK